MMMVPWKVETTEVATVSAGILPASYAMPGLNAWSVESSSFPCSDDPSTRQSPSRKRQRARPMAHTTGSLATPTTPPTFGLPIKDFKTESNVPPQPYRASSLASCASFAMTSMTSAAAPIAPIAPEQSDDQLRQLETMRTEDVLKFLHQCNLPVQIPSQTLTQVANNLVHIGFDKPLIIAFTNNQELMDCGLCDHANRQAVRQQATEQFRRSGFRGPGSFVFHDDRQVVHTWIRCCGIDDPDAQIYATKLFKLGYYGAQDLRHILQDEDSGAFREFKSGHERLFRYCVERAGGYEYASKAPVDSHQQHSPGFGVVLPAQQQLDAPPTHTNAPPTPFPASFNFGSNDHGLDQSHLEALLPLAPLGQFKMVHGGGGGMPPAQWLVKIPPEPQLQHFPAPPLHGSFSQGLNEPSYASQSQPVTTPGIYGHPPGLSTVAPAFETADQGPLPGANELPPQHLPVLDDTINKPRANPCRRIREIDWQTVANGESNDARVGRATSESFVRPTSVPSGRRAPLKSEMWTAVNIALLERAVADSRCRHLGKVCWEMLSSGRTGVDVYAPLAAFTASQLRSRYRSLFGDKQPQRLRQRKKLKRLQQEQVVQQRQQDQPDQLKQDQQDPVDPVDPVDQKQDR